jgi:hypothetical protein
MLAGVALPELSDPDPEIAGEGSLDPLGLAALADRLANELVPDVRARMNRVRFLTALTVGAVVTEELVYLPPTDGESMPSVCFEWLVLESFVRKNKQTQALEAIGIPGTSKASAVLAKGQRLTAANYLKAPRVFGFFGVYLPLAIGLRLVDDARLPGERWTELTRVWETENELDASPMVCLARPAGVFAIRYATRSATRSLPAAAPRVRVRHCFSRSRTRSGRWERDERSASFFAHSCCRITRP